MAVSRPMLVLMGTLLILVTFPQDSESYKILMMPMRQGSHVIEIGHIAKVLIKGGHEVVLVLHEDAKVPENAKIKGIKWIRWNSGNEKTVGEFDNMAAGRAFGGEVQKSLFSSASQHAKIIHAECQGALGNDELKQKLEAEKFDFAIIDGLFFVRCFYLFPLRLGIPYATLLAHIPGDIFPTSFNLPSVQPPITLDITTEMTFFQRLQSLFTSAIPYNLVEWFVLKKSIYEPFAEGKQFQSFSQLAQKSEIWFINISPLLEQPQPSPPNFIYTGGLSTAPAKPLTDTLKSFADAAPEGMVVFSFGSSIAYLPDDVLQKYLSVFKMFPKFHFLMRNTNRNIPAPKNVIMLDWLPQNDALGHPKTKLFITHCGSGGQHEALYHGVPMLGFPGAADQKHNAARILRKGFGLRMGLLDFTEVELTEKLNTLLYEDYHRNNIKKASKIYHDALNKQEDLVLYWVEHVIKYGGDHLRATSNLQWYQILMWDVCLFFAAIFCVILYSMIKLCTYLGRKCFHQTKKIKTT